jgi:hypothetical protein
MSYPEEEEMNPEGEVLVATTATAVVGPDEVDALGENGEALSKNALKKRLKAEKAAQARAEKEAAKKVRNLWFLILGTAPDSRRCMKTTFFKTNCSQPMTGGTSTSCKENSIRRG